LHNLTFIDTSHFVSSSADTARILIGSGVAFWIGALYILMFTFQLGFITQYLTEPFVNSFTCGYAHQVIASQLKSLCGLHMKTYSGALKLPKVKNINTLIGYNEFKSCFCLKDIHSIFHHYCRDKYLCFNNFNYMHYFVPCCSNTYK
jgi:hypothetical protein